MASADEHVPVLIVGAGPTGLVLSALLSRFGVESLLIDRDPTTTDHPQAHVVNTRTMEIFRSLGIADAVYGGALSGESGGHVRWVESLAGSEFASLSLAPPPEMIPMLMAATPAVPCSCAQDLIEPILAEVAQRGPGRVQFSTTVTDISQDGAGVVATITHDGSARRISADWLIGSDGAASTTRRLVGIPMVGPDALARIVGIYFHADLSELLAERPSVLYWTIDAESPGTFIAMDGRYRWVFHAPTDAEEFDPSVYNDDCCQQILRRAIGAEVNPEVRSVRPWVMTAQVAARYREGRVLLAGDAAHRFPPTGGFGMNTGVQDSHNLAWKLAAVIGGQAGEALLDTYEQERLGVAQGNSDFSFRNLLGVADIMGPGAQAQARRLESGEATFEEVAADIQAIADRERAHFGAFGRDLGFHYGDGAIVSDGTAPPHRDDPDREYIPNACPGARAPHFAIVTDGVPGSSLDLFDGQWTLLCGSEAADDWKQAASAQSAAVQTVAVGADVADSGNVFASLYGVEDGAVLVRPDGHVGWRARNLPSRPIDALATALGSLLKTS